MCGLKTGKVGSQNGTGQYVACPHEGMCAEGCAFVCRAGVREAALWGRAAGRRQVGGGTCIGEEGKEGGV